MDSPPTIGAKKRGRPRKLHDAKRTSFSTRLRDTVREKLQQAADRAKRSLSQEIEHRLEKSISREALRVDLSELPPELMELMQRMVRWDDLGPYCAVVEALSKPDKLRDRSETGAADFEAMGGNGKPTTQVGADPEARIWELAEEIADNALRDSRSPHRERQKQGLMALVYEVISERVVAGAAVDDPEMPGIVADIIRRLVARRFRVLR